MKKLILKVIEYKWVFFGLTLYLNLYLNQSKMSVMNWDFLHGASWMLLGLVIIELLFLLAVKIIFALKLNLVEVSKEERKE